MKVSMVCMDCERLGLYKEGGVTLYPVPVLNDSVYDFECRYGHKCTTFIQSEKFEILFEIALNAILDGYYREAVTSAASSLERFYEYFVRLIVRSKGLDLSEFDKTWNCVKNMSERQIGMFVAVYLMHFKKAPLLMAKSQSAFRNDVVHKGRIPQRMEAVAYLNSVAAIVNPLLLELKQTVVDAIRSMRCERVEDGYRKHSDRSLSTMALASFFSLHLSSTQPHPITIEEKLVEMENRRYRWDKFTHR